MTQNYHRLGRVCLQLTSEERRYTAKSGHGLFFSPDSSSCLIDCSWFKTPKHDQEFLLLLPGGLTWQDAISTENRLKFLVMVSFSLPLKFNPNVSTWWRIEQVSGHDFVSFHSLVNLSCINNSSNKWSNLKLESMTQYSFAREGDGSRRGQVLVMVSFSLSRNNNNWSRIT